MAKASKPARTVVRRVYKSGRVKITVRAVGARVLTATDTSEPGKTYRAKVDRLGKDAGGRHGCPHCGSHSGDYREVYSTKFHGMTAYCMRCSYKTETAKKFETKRAEESAGVFNRHSRNVMPPLTGRQPWK